MALRMLGDAAGATKIPLAQTTEGLVTLNGSFGGIPRAFVLDTTVAGVAHKCWGLPVKTPDKWGTIDEFWKEECPRECSSNLTIPMVNADLSPVKVDPIASNLTVGDISIPTFRSARICSQEVHNVFNVLGMGGGANGVVGLGPGAPASFANGSAALDTIPWSKYSIFLTKNISESGSFLLPGGVDADMIASQALVETKLPAMTDTLGWTVNIDGFSTSAASIQANCTPATPCKAAVAASSPMMYLSEDLWSSVLAGFERRGRTACGITNSYIYVTYMCADWAPLPTLSFTFGDRTFTMNKTDYTIPVPSSSTGDVYVMVAQKNRHQPFTAEWVLGAPFLRAFYASFDKDAKTVSFFCKDGVNCGAKGKSTAPGAASGSGGRGVAALCGSLVALIAAVALAV